MAPTVMYSGWKVRDEMEYIIGHTDLGVILIGIVAISGWTTRMIYNVTKTTKLAWKGEDWRYPAYELCGEVFATIFSVIMGFVIITN